MKSKLIKTLSKLFLHCIVRQTDYGAAEIWASSPNKSLSSPVVPILVYGCETWALLTVRDGSGMQNKILQRLLRMSY